MVNTRTGQTAALFDDPGIGGTSPVFSPSGDLLAFYDLTQKAIRLFDFNSGSSDWIYTQVEQAVSFSPEGEIVYIELQADMLLPIGVLYRMDLETKSVDPLLGEGLTSFDATSPRWAGSGDWIAFGAQSVNPGAARQLWIVHPDGSGLRAVINDESASHAAPAWSPDGGRLAFQRLELGGSDHRPEIVVWDADLGVFSVLVQDAALPAWLR